IWETLMMIIFKYFQSMPPDLLPYYWMSKREKVQDENPHIPLKIETTKYFWGVYLGLIALAFCVHVLERIVGPRIIRRGQGSARKCGRRGPSSSKFPSADNSS